MNMLHKRMFEIEPSERNNLYSYAIGNIYIRPARNGENNVYVVETDDKFSINEVERLVRVFAID